MPVNAEELIRLLAMLSEEEQMKVAVRQTLKGGLIAGSFATVGGLLGGPVGIAVGGALGGAWGAWATKGKFRPVSDILIDMNKEQRVQLQEYFNLAFRSLTTEDFTALNKMVAGDEQVRRKMLYGLKTYFNDELKMVIVD
ncbi:protein C19orf12 homolog [Glandiceps talaboti]